MRLTGKIFHGPNAMHDADRWFVKADNTILPEVGSEIIIPPGAEFDPLKKAAIESDEPLQPEEVGNDMSLSAVAVVHLQYFDISGNFYWTDLCWFRTTDRLMAKCDHHNEIH
jgi:hypothetical protein